MSNNSSVVPPVIYTYSETANILYGLFSVTLFLIGKTISDPNIFTNSRLKPQPSIVEIISNSLSQIGLEEHLLFTCHHETLNKYLYAVIFRLQVQIIQDNLFLGTSANSVTLSYFLQSSSYKTISKFINQSVS